MLVKSKDLRNSINKQNCCTDYTCRSSDFIWSVDITVYKNIDNTVNVKVQFNDSCFVKSLLEYQKISIDKCIEYLMYCGAIRR